MNRCMTHFNRRLWLGACVLGASALLHTLPVQAQMARLFPQGVQRGTIEFTAPPQIRLNGQPDRLAPGARVRGTQNTVVLSGALVGQSFLVNYFRDPAGVIRDIWLLTPAEAGTLPDGTPAPSAPSGRESLYGG